MLCRVAFMPVIPLWRSTGVHMVLMVDSLSRHLVENYQCSGLHAAQLIKHRVLMDVCALCRRCALRERDVRAIIEET